MFSEKESAEEDWMNKLYHEREKERAIQLMRVRYSFFEAISQLQQIELARIGQIWNVFLSFLEIISYYEFVSKIE